MILKVKDENGQFKEVILKGTRGEKGDKGDRGEDGTVLQQKEIDDIKSSLDNIVKQIYPTMSTLEIQNILNKGGNIKFNCGNYLLDYTLVNEITNANGDRTVGLYLDIMSNTNLFFDKNVIINIKTCPKDFYRVIRILDKENITINGGYIIGDRKEHIQEINEGQWGYGLYISRSKNIEIKNLVVKDCYGDGITTGMCENVNIYNCVSDNNRRQALTIGSGENITVDNCVFINTNGQAPQAGIDIEPDLASQSVRDIVIKNCLIKGNSSSGIEINLSKLNVQSMMEVKPVSIFIDNCKICNNDKGIHYFYYVGDSEQFLNNVGGFIKVTNCHIYENRIGILFLNVLDKVMPKFICENSAIRKWTSSGISFQRYGFTDGASENNVVEYGGCYFNSITFYDVPKESTYACPIYIQPYDYTKFNGVFKNIYIDGDVNPTNWCVWKLGDGNISYINTNNTVKTIASTNYSRLNGLNVIFSSGSTHTLPNPKYIKGREFNFINNITGEHYYLELEAETSFDSSFVVGLKTCVKGNSSTLKLRSNGTTTWETVEKIGDVLPEGFSNSRKFLMGVGKPTTGTWQKGDKIYNYNVSNNGVEYWICMEDGTPGTWTYGGVCDWKRLDPITNSSATTVDQLKNEFNSLLNKMRNNGLLRE